MILKSWQEAPIALPMEAKDRLCTRCLHVGKPKTSKAAYACWWLLGVWVACGFLLPGLIPSTGYDFLIAFAIGSLTNILPKVCGKCGESKPVPLDSPAAVRMLAK